MLTSRVASHRLRCVVVVAFLTVVVAPGPAVAQSAEAPDSFSTNVAGTGMLIEVSAPAALPLDVLVGIAYAQVGVNSQPRIQSTAAPVFVPLFDALGLLGGTSGVLGVVIRLAPGLIVGSPSLVGLEPLPIDPSLVPTDPLADAVASLPLPSPPQLGCTSQFPDEPSAAECGGGAQDFFGYRIGAGSARTSSSGSETDASSLRSRSDASATGISPTSAASLAPLSLGAVAATSESSVVDGRIVAVSSAGASDLDIAGQLSIESVRASFSGALGGTAESVDEAFECNISGVRAGGQEIELGTDTITLAGEDTPVGGGGIAGLVNDLLNVVGGEAGGADFGTITVTPNPEPVATISEDGTSLERRFGCLEVRYRNLTAGTDIRLTFGNVTVAMTAFNDEPFAPAPVSGGDAGLLGSAPSTPSGGPPTFADGGPTGDELSLPEAPSPGSEAPTPSATEFFETSTVAGWGIDGAWLAPFSLLALSIPLLVRSRRFTIATNRS